MKKLSTLLMLFAFMLGFSQPTTNAPTPTALSANVVSIFSDSYSNIATNYNPFWGQSGAVNPTFEAVSGSGNNVLAYTNFNYQGTDLTATNLASMEFLHIDVWTNANPANTILQVSPINNGSGAGETLVTINYTQGQWTSVNIPKSSFTGMTWDNVFQLKFAANGAGSTVPADIYLDNIYFWKAAVNPTADATLSDLKVDGTTIAGFSSATTTYTKQYPQGTTTVPQITAATTTNASATKVITQATTIPGTATVLVTAQDGTTTKTYTVNYTLSGPAVKAPTPPARPAADVISLFSNAYSNIGVSEWSTSWDDSSIADIQVQGDDVKKITFNNFLGVQLTDFVNASGMTHFHIDYFIDNGVDLVGKVINSKWSNHGNAPTPGETSAFLLNTIPTTTGTWVSVDVPITAFDTAPQTRNALYQFLMISNIGTVYVDNIYFHKNTTLGTSEFNAKKALLYPNPVNAGENVVLKGAKSLQIIDANGRIIRNENGEEINTSGLTKGIYIVKSVNANGEISSTKLIVK